MKICLSTFASGASLALESVGTTSAEAENALFHPRGARAALTSSLAGLEMGGAIHPRLIPRDWGQP